MIALYYGKGDFTETLHIITMCGVDVDCNAGMIMPILAIQKGMGIIPSKLNHPVFAKLITYLRGEKSMTLDELAEDTLNSILNAKKQEEEV